MVSRRIPAMADPIPCEACGLTFALDEPTDLDASFRALAASGWMHFARRGVGRERWAWKCPTCKPTGKPMTQGLVTPGPPTSSKREA